MRKIKYEPAGKCHTCGEPAKWKTHNITETGKRSCDAHKAETEEYEKKYKRPPDDGHMSEADYQTWGRL